VDSKIASCACSGGIMALMLGTVGDLVGSRHGGDQGAEREREPQKEPGHPCAEEGDPGQRW
jgi:hypothetical protein